MRCFRSSGFFFGVNLLSGVIVVAVVAVADTFRLVGFDSTDVEGK